MGLLELLYACKLFKTPDTGLGCIGFNEHNHGNVCYLLDSI